MSFEQASTQKPVIVTGHSQGIGAGNRSEASKTPSLRERRCATLRRSRSGPNVFGGSARTLRSRRGAPCWSVAKYDMRDQGYFFSILAVATISAQRLASAS